MLQWMKTLTKGEKKQIDQQHENLFCCFKKNYSD